MTDEWFAATMEKNQKKHNLSRKENGDTRWKEEKSRRENGDKDTQRKEESDRRKGEENARRVDGNTGQVKDGVRLEDREEDIFVPEDMPVIPEREKKSNVLIWIILIVMVIALVLQKVWIRKLNAEKEETDTESVIEPAAGSVTEPAGSVIGSPNEAGAQPID